MSSLCSGGITLDGLPFKFDWMRTVCKRGCLDSAFVCMDMLSERMGGTRPFSTNAGGFALCSTRSFTLALFSMSHHSYRTE